MSPAPELKLDRRQRILAEARRLFLSQGFHAVSLDSVIQASGGSKSAIYQYFKNKENLFSAVVKSVVQEVVERTFQPSDVPETLPDYLLRVANSYLRAILAPDTLSAMRQSMAFYSTMPEIPGHYFNDGMVVAARRLAKALEADGTLPLEPGETYENAAASFVSLVRGNLHFRALLDPDFTATDAMIDQQCRYAVARFLCSYEMVSDGRRIIGN